MQHLVKFECLSPFELLLTLNINKDSLTQEDDLLNRSLVYMNLSPYTTKSPNPERVRLETEDDHGHADYLRHYDTQSRHEEAMIQDLEVNTEHLYIKIVAVNKHEGFKFCVLKSRQVAFFRRGKRHSFVVLFSTSFQEKTSLRVFKTGRIWINLKHVKPEITDKELKKAKFADKQNPELYTARVYDFYSSFEQNSDFFFVVERDAHPGVIICSDLNLKKCNYLDCDQLKVKGTLIKYFQVYPIEQKSEITKDRMMIKKKTSFSIRIAFSLPIKKAINVIDCVITNSENAKESSYRVDYSSVSKHEAGDYEEIKQRFQKDKHKNKKNRFKNKTKMKHVKNEENKFYYTADNSIREENKKKHGYQAQTEDSLPTFSESTGQSNQTIGDSSKSSLDESRTQVLYGKNQGQLDPKQFEEQFNKLKTMDQKTLDHISFLKGDRPELAFENQTNPFEDDHLQDTTKLNLDRSKQKPDLQELYVFQNSKSQASGFNFNWVYCDKFKVGALLGLIPS